MRLIILTNGATIGTNERNALTAFLEAKQWAVWHWFNDVWLVDGVPQVGSVGPLRDEIRTAIPTLSQILIVAMPAGEHTYSGNV
ncbi:MAG TPA: hypothetical protein VI386_27790, partial [Candidatus Sulfotelmatobacter sp.]